MTYKATEAGAELRPVELYVFTQAAKVWRYTSHDAIHNYGGVNFQPSPIGRSKITESDTGARNELKISAPADHPIPAIFRTGPPIVPVNLTIYRTYENDPDQEYRVIWSGELYKASWSVGKCEVVGRASDSKLDRQGLRVRYTYKCTRTQYTEGCGLVFASYAEDASITTVENSGYRLTIDTLQQADGFYTGGLIKHGDYYATIKEHKTGNVFELFRPLYGAMPNTPIQVAPGCAQNWQTCRDTFNNLDNCMAFVDVPTDNPFTGDGLRGK